MHLCLKVARFFVLFFSVINISFGQEGYKYREEFLYNNDDSTNIDTTLRQIFNEKGKVIFEENIGWEKIFFTYKDTLLVSELHLQYSDSFDATGEIKFESYYIDTVKKNYTYTFDNLGRVIYRQESSWHYKARNPRTCTRNENLDYSREWRLWLSNIRYEYNSLGKKVSEISQNETLKWVYDDSGRIKEENNGTKKIIYEYIHDLLISNQIFLSSPNDTFQSITFNNSIRDSEGKILKENSIERNNSGFCIDTEVANEYEKGCQIERKYVYWYKDDEYFKRKTYFTKQLNSKPAWAK